ncbi:hypothetical protein Bca52824_001392 [Brassica carinata]|uniref:Uncharacterized protein n=1 Tax=Brassica carinata TaxID=52824 RepID=A0A8X7WJ11_BRACI|nr:hypothetical protein Bca52824_001392 [Brassica carinata]
MASSSTSSALCGISNLQNHISPLEENNKIRSLVKISPEVSEVLSKGLAVVALESTIISHGMPYPQILQTEKEVESIVRENRAVPATIAILNGVPCIGLNEEELERLASLGKSVQKTAGRDIAYVVATKGNGATRVSAILFFASMVGIQVFVTGGIGGVHRHANHSMMDISSDLTALGRTPIAVISAGVKSILDIPKTLEYLYLYWGNRIDCPGKNCEIFAGLGHQESSLRCALEEALFLNRTFVMPSGMCINPIHNKKGILDRSDEKATEDGWVGSSCAMDTLYDIDLISEKIHAILDDSKTWYLVLSTSMKLGGRGIAHVYGVSRHRLTESHYSNLLIINRTASPLAWFVECKDKGNRSNVMLPYSIFPNMAAATVATRLLIVDDNYDEITILDCGEVQMCNNYTVKC